MINKKVTSTKELPGKHRIIDGEKIVMLKSYVKTGKFGKDKLSKDCWKGASLARNRK